MSEDLEADVEAAWREQHVRCKPHVHASMDKRWWRGVEKLVLAAGGGDGYCQRRWKPFSNHAVRALFTSSFPCVSDLGDEGIFRRTLRDTTSPEPERFGPVSLLTDS